MLTYPLSFEKFIVFGLARSGIAAVQWILKEGGKVIAIDSDPNKQKEAQALGAEIGIPHNILWDEISAFVHSPGIPLTHPLSQQAISHKIPIISDCDLFRLSSPKAKIVGITGTNGKSTTTSLVGHILKQANHDVAIGGNIGIPILSLPKLGNEGIYVLELSSYQLEISSNLNVDIVGWINISPDHLERHGSIESYVAAKYKIFQHMKRTPTAIVGIDDPYSCEIFQKHTQNNSHQTIPVSCVHSLDNGIYVKEDNLFRAHKGRVSHLADLTKFPRLRGEHNYQNVAISYGIAESLGLEVKEIIAGIETFPGLEHRQELVAEIEGVTFINDSKATNADAASKALGVYNNIYWIAGGIAKKDGIGDLLSYSSSIKQAFLIGQAQDEFAATLENTVLVQKCGTLDVAVKQAFLTAKQSGEKNPIILLSPACASFDQFKDFEHRGNIFKELVNALRGSHA